MENGLVSIGDDEANVRPLHKLGFNELLNEVIGATRLDLQRIGRACGFSSCGAFALGRACL